MISWPLRRAAERFQVSVTTAARWADRYRDSGAGRDGRSVFSRPHYSPQRTPTRTERRIIKVRVVRRWGPARIGYLLGLHPATVHRVLTRYGMARLRWLDRPTGRVVRRMEPGRCGDLVHIDVKKLGKIPAGGGWRMLGRTSASAIIRPTRVPGSSIRYRQPVRGYHFLHTAIDGHSRLAYSELLADERKDTAAGLLGPRERLVHQQPHSRTKSVDRQWRLLSVTGLPRSPGRDRSSATRPYRPQTNGKVERFHRTLADEWAYARLYTSDTERCQQFPIWLHTYNHHRGHTALGGQPPATRVPNLSGQHN